MQLNIKSPEANALARDLAELTGESLTETVTKALEERLERERKTRSKEVKLAAIRKIVEAMGPPEDIDAKEILDEAWGVER